MSGLGKNSVEVYACLIMAFLILALGSRDGLANSITPNDLAEADQILQAAEESEITEEKIEDLTNILYQISSSAVVSACLLRSDSAEWVIRAFHKRCEDDEEFKQAVYDVIYQDGLHDPSPENREKLEKLRNILVPEYVCIDGSKVSFETYMWRDFMSHRPYANEKPEGGGSAVMGIVSLKAHDRILLPKNIMTGLNARSAILRWREQSWKANRFGIGKVEKEKDSEDNMRPCKIKFYWKDCFDEQNRNVGPFFGPAEPPDGATVIFTFEHSGRVHTLQQSGQKIFKTM